MQLAPVNYVWHLLNLNIKETQQQKIRKQCLVVLGARAGMLYGRYNGTRKYGKNKGWKMKASTLEKEFVHLTNEVVEEIA